MGAYLSQPVLTYCCGKREVGDVTREPWSWPTCGKCGLHKRDWAWTFGDCHKPEAFGRIMATLGWVWRGGVFSPRETDPVQAPGHFDSKILVSWKWSPVVSEPNAVILTWGRRQGAGR